MGIAVPIYEQTYSCVASCVLCFEFLCMSLCHHSIFLCHHSIISGLAIFRVTVYIFFLYCHTLQDGLQPSSGTLLQPILYYILLFLLFLRRLTRCRRLVYLLILCSRFSLLANNSAVQTHL